MQKEKVYQIGNIVIKMCKNLSLPNVNAYYNSEGNLYQASFSIRTGKLINGNLPEPQSDSVERWVVLNEDRLLQDWKFLK